MMMIITTLSLLSSLFPLRFSSSPDFTWSTLLSSSYFPLPIPSLPAPLLALFYCSPPVYSSSSHPSSFFPPSLSASSCSASSFLTTSSTHHYLRQLSLNFPVFPRPDCLVAWWKIYCLPVNIPANKSPIECRFLHSLNNRGNKPRPCDMFSFSPWLPLKHQRGDDNSWRGGHLDWDVFPFSQYLTWKLITHFMASLIWSCELFIDLGG